MAPPPPLVPCETPVSEVIERIVDGDATSAVVVDGDGVAVGIVTERDVLQRITFRESPETPVERVMTNPCRTIGADEYLFQAIAQMRRHGLRHMPVDDGRGRVVGILHLHVAMGIAATRTVERIDLLAHEGSIEGMARIKRAQVEVADEMIVDDVPKPDIQSLLTHINRDIHRRVIDICLQDMAAGEWGEPPVDFAAIIMGSGGRGENYVYPDQDNGFILDDYPDSDHTRIDAFFVELAERMTKTLDSIGFPFCKGYVMAINPLWRKTLSQWRQQTTLWAKRRGIVALRLSGIFYDFQPVYGNRALASALREHITRLTQNSPVYLNAMFKDGEDHGVALGWFGRFITEKDVEEHRGEINLKHSGTLPLVEAVRLLCLKGGIAETSTMRRLTALYQSGYLDGDELDYLHGAFRQISGLLLRQQVADFKAGRPVNNYVAPQSLSTRERDRLIDAFKAIANLRDRVRTDFTGDIF
ncbi:MAG: CBS domain-containing protein [Alphaproteobacteria bacterium]|nr:CBS domain-containing protein [Alphaproteobacteria bacterium]